ncbi:acyltransferase [Enterobacter huaxiensis]
MYIKVLWLIRNFFYKIFFFKKSRLYGYIGKPIYFTGLKNVSIGKKFRLYPMWRFEILESGTVTIEDDVSIGQFFHLVSLGSELVIKKGTVISADVLITNSDHRFNVIDVPIYRQPMNNKITMIGENCFIGAGAKILAGTTLGKQCVVGANSVVKGNFPDYCVISGIPAKIIKKYDVESKQWLTV